MEKLKMHSMDIINDNVKKLGELFPECLTEVINDDGELEKAIDFDKLKSLFSSSAIEGNKERYQFTWPDKSKARALANQPINATLRPCREESVNFDTTENLYIEGDNLDVLKLLRETYYGKVKMIYIDPPYNTGNDFVYEDDFSQDAETYKANSGQYDDQGNRLQKNQESNGRFHTDWLNMMYPRLKIARDFLTDNGVILISIDDSEQDNLRKICDEIFGRENFIDSLVWKKRYGGGAKEKYFVSLHEYVLVYCRNIDMLDDLYVPLAEESVEKYYSKKDSKFETRGGYRTHPLEAGKAMDARPNLVYPIPAPDGTMIWPKKQWLWSKERTMNALKNDELEILKGKDGWVVSTKQYLIEDGNLRSAKMLSIIDDVYTQHGTNEMLSIFNNAKIFQYPKPSAFVKQLVSVITETKDELVLDFFSGSASTAHAVMQLNAEDGGKRKFIMVQLPEACEEDSEAYKAGYKNICEIGKERIRRAGKKILEEQQSKDGDLFVEKRANLDIGFRVLKLDSSNMNDVYYHPENLRQDELAGLVSNIKEGRTDEDLLFQVMLDLGVVLSSNIEIEIIGGKKVFNVNKGYLLACFDEKVDEELITAVANKTPTYFVMRDSSLANDSVSVNFDQIFAKYSPDTTRKVL